MTINSPSQIYPSFVASCLSEEFVGNSFKFSLLSEDYIFDLQHSQFSEISVYEVSGSGYSQGGKETTISTSHDSDKTIFAISECEWISVDVTFKNIVCYEINSEKLVFVVSLPSSTNTNGANLKIESGNIFIGH